MKKISIETAALEALGASAKALQYYHDTDPIDIYQLEDGSYEVTGAIPFYAETVCDLLRELDALADEFGYEGANSAFDAHQAAPALYDGGWRPADAEQLKAEYDLTDEETAALVAELEEIARQYVINAAGTEIRFDAAVELMDDEIREELHASGDYDDDPQAFFTAYEAAHAARYGEPWELSKECPVW